MIQELLSKLSHNITQLFKAQDREFARTDSLSSVQYNKIIELNKEINNSVDTYIKLYMVPQYNATANTLRQIEVITEAVEEVMEKFPETREVFSKWEINQK